MSGTKGIYEHLVEQTVHNVLFREVIPESTEPSAMTISMDSVRDIVNQTSTMGIREELLLHLLTNSYQEDPAEEDEDNNADEGRRDSWMVDCPNWSIDRLRREKAAIKRYLNVHRQELVNNEKKSKLTGDALILHEVYALLKLFLLERDPDYRQCLEQSIGCTNSFLKSLQLQLTLYATYFERAHRRQISEKTDVKPIENLYAFFLTHHRASKQQQIE